MSYDAFLEEIDKNNETERSVSYSVGAKLNIGNFQNVSVHVSESRRFTTLGLTKEQVNQQSDEEHAALREVVDQRLLDALNEVKTSFGI